MKKFLINTNISIVAISALIAFCNFKISEMPLITNKYNFITADTSYTPCAELDNKFVKSLKVTKAKVGDFVYIVENRMLFRGQLLSKNKLGLMKVKYTNCDNEESISDKYPEEIFSIIK
ncbi:MAG: hypothetical protein SFY32_07535 [Bacteroidota bacterium]|nr:hypothetical protein [Bacteroidota bacterium]